MRYRSRHVRCSLAFSFYGTLRFNWSSKDPTADIRCASSATTSAPIPFGGTRRYYHVYVHHGIVLLPPKKLTADSTSNRVVVVKKKRIHLRHRSTSFDHRSTACSFESSGCRRRRWSGRSTLQSRRRQRWHGRTRAMRRYAQLILYVLRYFGFFVFPSVDDSRSFLGGMHGLALYSNSYHRPNNRSQDFSTLCQFTTDECFGKCYRK